MHEVESKLKPICEMKERLIDICKSELSRTSIAEVDSKELGEAIDMIKDLTEAEKACWEAHYYKKVTEAMEEPQDDWRMGYNAGRMGMTGGGGNGSSSSSNNLGSGSSGRSGSMGSSAGSGGSGYSRNDPSSDIWYASRYPVLRYPGLQGLVEEQEEMKNPYEEWKKARRHYTETGSKSDKDDMDSAASQHVSSAIATMRDIWKSAEPEQRKRMKEDLQGLLNDMK